MSAARAPATPAAEIPELPSPPPATLAEIRRQLGWGLIHHAHDADDGE